MLNTYLKGSNRYADIIEYRMTATEFKRWRQFHGWTQAQAARQLGLSRAVIANYETSGKIPEYIEKICEKITY